MSIAKEGLADVVDYARAEGLVKLLALALDVTRQTIYLWGNRGEHGVSPWIAEARLGQLAKLDPSVLEGQLSGVVALAREKLNACE